MPIHQNHEQLLEILEPIVAAPMWEHLEKEDLLPLRDYYGARDHADFHLIDPVNHAPDTLHNGMTHGLTGQVISVPFSLALQLHDSLRSPAVSGGEVPEAVKANLKTTVEAFKESKSASVFLGMPSEKYDKLLVAKRTTAAVMGAFAIAATRGTNKKLYARSLELVYDEFLISRQQRRVLKQIVKHLDYTL